MTSAETRFLAEMKKRQKARDAGWRNVKGWCLQVLAKPNPKKGQKDRPNK